MAYSIKEMFYTIQGEGGQTGRPAVFCRFSGCNLWSGREADRASSICTFCDTDFVGTDGPGGGVFQTPDDLVRAVASHWPRNANSCRRCVVCTGGEPLLQLDEPAIEAFHNHGFDVAIETNGTRIAPPGLDWICVSPKPGYTIRQRSGDELKLVYPQPNLTPESVEDLDFTYLYLQPMDGPDWDRNIQDALAYCMEHPRWRLGVQTHKLIGCP